MERKVLQRRFWQEVSLRSTLLCAAGVFCLFAPFGFLVDVIDAGRHTARHLAFLVLLSGIMAVGYFVAGSRRWLWALAGLGAFQVAVTYGSLPFFPTPPLAANVAALRGRLVLDGLGIIALLIASYHFLMAFIGSEGVRQVSRGQMALGILAAQTYAESSVQVETGDVLALVTDGLTEVEDRRGRELGLEGIEAALRAGGGGSLDDLLQTILAAARAHGPQRDDQTVLLVRVGLPR